MIDDRKSLRAALRDRFPRERGQLLPALHFLQHEFGYLPDWAMEVTGWHLGVPASEVYGAATSYTELRIDKPGEHVLRVCTGLGCLDKRRQGAPGSDGVGAGPSSRRDHYRRQRHSGGDALRLSLRYGSRRRAGRQMDGTRNADLRRGDSPGGGAFMTTVSDAITRLHESAQQRQIDSRWGKARVAVQVSHCSQAVGAVGSRPGRRGRVARRRLPGNYRLRRRVFRRPPGERDILLRRRPRILEHHGRQREKGRFALSRAAGPCPTSPTQRDS